VREEMKEKEWIPEAVEMEFQKKRKELEEIVAQDGGLIYPEGAEEDPEILRDFLIEHYMVKNPEMTEAEILEKVENEVERFKRALEEFNKPDRKRLQINARHYELALTNPEQLKKELLIDYKEYYADKDDEWVEKKIDEMIESLKIGALRRFGIGYQA